MNTDFDTWVEEVEDLIQMSMAEHERNWSYKLFNAQLTPHEASCFMMREDDFR